MNVQDYILMGINTILSFVWQELLPIEILNYNYYIFLFCIHKIDNEFNIECNTSKEKENIHCNWFTFT